MGRKLVRNLDDLRFPRNENLDSHIAREEVASEVLRYKEEFEPGLKLWQLKGVPTGQGKHQIPDFLVEFPNGAQQAIEIGTTGTKRVDALKKAVDDVLRVKRGTSFHYEGLSVEAKASCRALTRTGRRCQKKATPGNYGYCSLHR